MADEEILDSHCFLTLFNQRLFDETVSRKKIIPEVGFNLSDGTYPEIDVQIKRRGWRRLASPQDEVAKAMVREFHANVGCTDEQMVGLEQHPYTSYVGGKTIDFSPENIKKVMRFKEETRGAQFNYHQRHPTEEELDLILRELCEDGATWKMGKGKDPKPIQLRRPELTNLAREPNLDHQYEHHWEQPPYVEPIPQLEQPPPQYNYQQQPQYVTYAGFQQFQQSQIDQMQSYQQSQTQLMEQYQQSQAEMMQQYQQKQLEAQQQGFQKLNEQVANMQIGIHNELGQYKEELNTLKGKQQESFVNTNNMCNRILREQERMNKELIDLKKWQVSETVGRNEQSNKIMDAWNEQRGYMEGMSKQMKN
ncbi:hypothetical protein PIB30_063419 [Stylosanthes scabra]|uniref:Putative plant transposon protein domain-containing protein n=1 Tax=Stylosanthes scabra TaxID=79078 RepID=A0ABU6TM33_9FABA|nr:hypothetical protein [Stylosanthes scabra]